MKKLFYSIFFLSAVTSLNGQTLFTENFEGALGANMLTTGWTETGLSTDGIYMVGDDVDANIAGFWPVPAHTLFAMTNDDACNCDKSADRLIFPVQDFSGVSAGSSLTLNYAAVNDDEYGGSTTVEVSLDGGATWTSIATVPLTTATYAWQTLSTSLNAYVGMSNVTISFLFNDEAGWATGFAVDDITIVQAPGTDDLEVSGFLAEYTVIPVSQVFSMPLEGDITNNGSTMVADAVLTVNVYLAPDFVTPVTTLTSAPTSVGVSSTITLNVGSFTPAAIGTYAFEYIVSAASITDVDASNDVAYYAFDVDPNVFARDNFTADMSLGIGAGATGIIGVNFNLTNDAVLSSVTFAAGGLTAGIPANLHIYNTDGTGMPTTLVTTVNFLAPDAGPVFDVPAGNFPLVAGNYFFGIEEDVAINMAMYFADTIFTASTAWVQINGGAFAAIETFPFGNITPIVQPSFVDCSTLAAAPVITDVTCNGLNDGSIDVNATGGTAPYTVTWTGPAGYTGSGETITGLAPGTYDGVLTDANGCTQSGPLIVAEPVALSVAVTTSVDPTVCGASDGSVDVTVSGGTLPYTYLWSDATTSEDLTGAAAGSYDLTVTDGNLCTADLSVSLSDPNGPTLSVDMITPVMCNGGTDGGIAISVVLNGGATSSTALWSNSTTAEDLTGVAAGSYSVVITDNNGCSSSIGGTVTQPTAISFAATTTDETIAGNGAIDLTVSGGTSPYTYSWSNSATTEDLTGITGGTYTVTVTDANDCTADTTITVNSSAGIDDNNGSPVFSLYPNPSNGNFIIEVTASASVVVFNVVGEAVYSSSLNAGTNNINIGDAADGIYIVNVMQDNTVSQLKIVKQ